MIKSSITDEENLSDKKLIKIDIDSNNIQLYLQRSQQDLHIRLLLNGPTPPLATGAGRRRRAAWDPAVWS